MQTRINSMIESLTNIVVGVCLNFALNWVLLPALLHIPHPTGMQNLELTVIFTVVSFIRSYGLRRLFNRARGVADSRDAPSNADSSGSVNADTVSLTLALRSSE